MKDLNHRVRIYDMVISRLPASVPMVLCFFIEVSLRSSTIIDFLNISRVQHGWNAAYTLYHKELRSGMQGGRSAELRFSTDLSIKMTSNVIRRSNESGGILFHHSRRVFSMVID